MNNKVWEIELINKKYNIIYADPPWQNKVWSKKYQGRSVENHYNTMNVEEIKMLRIQDIADDNVIFFYGLLFHYLKKLAVPSIIQNRIYG